MLILKDIIEVEKRKFDNGRINNILIKYTRKAFGQSFVN